MEDCTMTPPRGIHQKLGVVLIVTLVMGLVATVTGPALAAARKSRSHNRATGHSLTAAKTETPPAAETSDPKAAWSKARNLADEGRHAEALAVIRAALRDHPDNTDLLWLEAGVTGWAGNHKESVGMFERLFQSHPELSPEMRLDLGTQEIWAGDPVAALRDIDLYLAAHPDDFEALQTRALALSHANRLGESLALYDQLQRRNPGNLDVALDRAQVLSWMGRHEEANASYERILKDHPGDERARMGLAQSLNSSGQHRRAAAMYEEMQRQGSKDPEVAKGLAYARYWSGRPDRAREALNEYLVQRPDDAEGRSLATQLARDQNRGLTVGYSSSEDSDDLRVRRTSLEYRWPVDETTAWSLRGHTGEVDDPGGRLHPFDLGVKHEKTWSDRWSSQVAASAYRPDDGKPAVGIGELNLTHRPNDRFRVDFGLAKEPVVTRKALEDGIRVSILTGGVDWRASERVRLHADQRFYYYNDDNQQSRTSMAARAWMADFSHGRIGVTFGVERLSTNHDLDHGYYDPGLYTEFGPGVEIEKELREGWDLGIKARVGMQKERNAKQEPYHNLDASLEVPLGTLLGFGFEISNSNSNLTSSSGFARTEWAAYLTKGF